MKTSPILTIQERENAGSIASNRFTYQVNWGVCKLIELHELPQSYFLLMEKHDDVLICDDVINPSFIEFYQIKTRKGSNWTIFSLTRNAKKSGSIVSKMYSSREKFGNLASKLSFRTDTFFKIKKNDDIKTHPPIESFQIRDLSPKEKEKVILSISKHYKIDPNLDLDGLFEFKKEKSSYDNHTEVAMAELARYFDIVLDKPFKGFIYNFIAGEVLRKNNYEGALQSDEELIKLKSISRNEFDDWLVYCSNNIKTSEDKISDLKIELINIKKLSFKDRKKYIKQAEKYNLLTKTSKQIIIKFKNIIIENCEDVNGENILECAEKILTKIESKILFIDYYQREFKLSAIMLELC